jgi:hypothetical protein
VIFGNEAVVEVIIFDLKENGLSVYIVPTLQEVHSFGGDEHTVALNVLHGYEAAQGERKMAVAVAESFSSLAGPGYPSVLGQQKGVEAHCRSWGLKAGVWTQAPHVSHLRQAASLLWACFLICKLAAQGLAAVRSTCTAHSSLLWYSETLARSTTETTSHSEMGFCVGLGSCSVSKSLDGRRLRGNCRKALLDRKKARCFTVLN